jgi:CubicO group peptidase (beta-lactamase class C family)
LTTKTCLLTTVITVFMLSACESGHQQAIAPKAQAATTPQQNPLIKKVDALFAEYDYTDSPGASLGIIRDGSFVYKRGYGMASLEHSIPNSPTTVSRIYSMSKHFTAFCILLLEQDGKLSLDDDVRKYFPQLPDYGKTMTIRHLIHHTNGLRDYLQLAWLQGRPLQYYYDEAGLLPLIASQKDLNFEIGSAHSYNNTGYLLLSLLVGKVSGQPLSQFAQERIFAPLGMKQTHFHDDESKVVHNRAWGYFPNDNGGFSIRRSTHNTIMGCGGMMSTVEDYYLWDQFFYANKLVGKEVMARFITSGTLDNGEKAGYAFGLNVGERNGLSYITHSGAAGAFRSTWIQIPEERFSVILLANHSELGPDSKAWKIIDMFLSGKGDQTLAAIKTPQNVKFIDIDPQELEEKAGRYQNTKTGSIYRFRVRDGSLEVSTREHRMVLSATGPNTFICAKSPTGNLFRFEFEKRKGSERSWVKALYNGQRTWTLKPIYRVRLEEEQLRQYVGKYYNEDLDVTYELAMRDGRLYFMHRWAPSMPMRPRLTDNPKSLDSFCTYSHMEYDFKRNKEGSVIGFTLNASRTKNLYFNRVVDRQD